MKIQNNVSLKDFTSIKMGGSCTDFCVIESQQQLPELIGWSKELNKRLLILGGGSNLVLNDRLFDGLVLKIEIKGVEVLEHTANSVVLRVGAGVNWDEFVAYTVSQGYWGAENMSLIPGTVGALPVQNVSAYGQEASRIVSSVHVYDRCEDKFEVLKNEDCRFSWRHSIFNTTHRDRYIITAVEFKLSTSPLPNLKRGDLKKKFDELSGNIDDSQYSQDQLQALIRSAVIDLRSSGRSLPVGETEYNSGTFFRASLVNKKKFYSIFCKVLFNLGYKTALKVLACRLKFKVGSDFKLPSNLLIKASSCCKSSSKNFNLFQNNPAVLIHNGKGSSEEFIEYINLVRDCVFKKSGVLIPIEPEFIDIDKRGLNY